VRITTVAHAAFARRPGKPGSGRHRQWGSPIKLRELFAPIEACSQASVWLYGKSMRVYYQCFELTTISSIILLLLIDRFISKNCKIDWLSKVNN
jgi:hypothetical protein